MPFPSTPVSNQHVRATRLRAVVMYWRLGVVSSSLVHPLTRKSIRLRLLWRCVRAFVRSCVVAMLPLWLWLAVCKLSGWSAVPVRPSGRSRWSWSSLVVPLWLGLPAKSFPMVSRCFPSLSAALPQLAIAFRCEIEAKSFPNAPRAPWCQRVRLLITANHC